MKRPKCSAGNVQCGAICLPKGKKCREGEQYGQKTAARNQSFIYNKILGGDATANEITKANRQNGMTKKIAKDYMMEISADYIESTIHGGQSRVNQINKKYGKYFGLSQRNDAAGAPYDYYYEDSLMSDYYDYDPYQEAHEYALGYLEAKGVEYDGDDPAGFLEGWLAFREDAAGAKCDPAAGWVRGPGGKCIRKKTRNMAAGALGAAALAGGAALAYKNRGAIKAGAQKAGYAAGTYAGAAQQAVGGAVRNATRARTAQGQVMRDRVKGAVAGARNAAGTYAGAAQQAVKSGAGAVDRAAGRAAFKGMEAVARAGNTETGKKVRRAASRVANSAVGQGVSGAAGAVSNAAGRAKEGLKKKIRESNERAVGRVFSRRNKS